MNARRIKIIHEIVATIAFTFGPPGAFIHLVRFGKKSEARPSNVRQVPMIRNIVFKSSTIITSV